MKILLKNDVANFITLLAKDIHPKEMYLLLRGKIINKDVLIEEALIPPLPTFGRGFSGFPLSMLPINLRVLGTVHSHPSGYPRPSVTDLNHMIGKVMLIVSFPYRVEDIYAYNSKGEELKVIIIK